MNYDVLGRTKWIDESKQIFIDRWGITRQFLNDLLPVPIDWPIKTPADLVYYKPPNPEEDPLLERIEKLIARYKGKRATFILGRDGWTQSYMVRGMENILVDMLTEPQLAHDILGMLLNYYKIVQRKAIAMGLDIIHLADDYAYHTGPLMSPDHFEEFLAPCLREMVADIKAQGAYCIKHTDGNIHKILPSIVNAGIDGIGPLEPEGSMVLADIKKAYPHLTVMGNISCDLLGMGTESDIEQAVKSLIDSTAAGGHYIMASGNSITYATLPANLKTMINVTKEYGVYSNK
jgi:uroporphyrinogen decarboxylase